MESKEKRVRTDISIASNPITPIDNKHIVRVRVEGWGIGIEIGNKGYRSFVSVEDNKNNSIIRIKILS